MNTEELLKPRWKVIADYPNIHGWKVGDIIDRDWAHYPDDDESQPAIWRISQFPHLFKKLKWWEYRKPEEMPQYVKCVEAPDQVHFKNKIYKVEWDSVLGRDEKGYAIIVETNCYVPATQEEYEAFSNPQ